MPELPDLEIIRRVQEARLVDVPIASAEVLRPLVVRNLLAAAACAQPGNGKQIPGLVWMFDHRS